MANRRRRRRRRRLRYLGFTYCGEDPIDKLLENYGTSHIERQTDEGEYEMESPIFRLATPCVSAHREARYRSVGRKPTL